MALNDIFKRDFIMLVLDGVFLISRVTFGMPSRMRFTPHSLAMGRLVTSSTDRTRMLGLALVSFILIAESFSSDSLVSAPVA
jgi:hypothetical protein